MSLTVSSQILLFSNVDDVMKLEAVGASIRINSTRENRYSFLDYSQIERQFSKY